MIHHQLNLVVLLGTIGLLHVLVDRFLVLSQALFHVFRLQWRAGDGGTQVEDVEAMFRRLRRRLELFRFLLQDVVRRGALDERSDRTHAARAFLPRSRSLRLTGVGASVLPSISGGLELWRNESSEKSFKKINKLGKMGKFTLYDLENSYSWKSICFLGSIHNF